MVCFILIFAFVNIEASYDKFNENSNRLCRVTTNWWLEGNIDESPMCASEASPWLVFFSPTSITNYFVILKK
jgi:hypothetical protein